MTNYDCILKIKYELKVNMPTYLFKEIVGEADFKAYNRSDLVDLLLKEYSLEELVEIIINKYNENSLHSKKSLNFIKKINPYLEKDKIIDKQRKQDYWGKIDKNKLVYEEELLCPKCGSKLNKIDEYLFKCSKPNCHYVKNNNPRPKFKPRFSSPKDTIEDYLK